MKYLLLLIAASLLSLNGYSQDIKTINLGLAKGLECCGNYKNVEQQLIYADSIAAFQAEQLENLKDQVFLSKANTDLLELRESEAIKQVNEYAGQLDREIKRKRTWRTLFFISSGLLAGYYGYNAIN